MIQVFINFHLVKNYNDLTKELGKAGDMVVVIYMYDEVPMRNTIFEMEVMARDHSNVKFLKGAINECEQFASLRLDSSQNVGFLDESQF